MVSCNRRTAFDAFDATQAPGALWLGLTCRACYCHSLMEQGMPSFSMALAQGGVQAADGAGQGCSCLMV